MAEHSPLPWAIRPHQYDDWGFVRGADGHIACIARGEGIDTHDAHRSAGTDPYQANAALIVKAVNAHEALVKALQRIAEQHLSEERLVEGGDYEYGYEQIIKVAREALAAVGHVPHD